ncbi:MAG: GNAT family N-acetyltransferase [Ktedonobacterales bacterium]
MPIEISRASTPEQLDAVRSLMRAFVEWHRERHDADRALIDQYFDAKTFDAELSGLPGKYAPPCGCLLLARLDERPAGYVALREIDADTCEMKRMFVAPTYRGKGLGRALAEAIIYEAKTIGYTTMRLDTSVRQVEALRLYESIGFREIAPYYDVPSALKEWLIFMELDLLGTYPPGNSIGSTISGSPTKRSAQD